MQPLALGLLPFIVTGFPSAYSEFLSWRDCGIPLLARSRSSSPACPEGGSLQSEFLSRVPGRWFSPVSLGRTSSPCATASKDSHHQQSAHDARAMFLQSTRQQPFCTEMERRHQPLVTFFLHVKL